MVGGSLRSSTTKTSRHDILVAEILLKVALKHKQINQIKSKRKKRKRQTLVDKNQ